MRLYSLLSLAVLGSAFVLPSQELFAQIELEDHERLGSWRDEILATEDQLAEGLNDRLEEAQETSSRIWSSIKDVYHHAVEPSIEQFNGYFETADRPHDPHHKPNLTVYQLIASSKYTTTLAKYINKYEDLVDALNSTNANFTVFAPTDAAFEKIPEHDHSPSKEFIKDVLTYHVVPGLYPAGRVLVSATAPTLLKSDSLGYKSHPQRISFQLGLRGLTVNFFSRVVAVNIEGTNGVIHGVDSILLPPLGTIDAIDLFPSQFSTLELGLAKTGLLDELNTTDHAGGTFFAPSNFAFSKLGPRVNAFLFSKYGRKYLKALLTYHVVPEHTLYRDAYIDATKEKDESSAESIPKGIFHVDLPTLLEDRKLSIDIARYGSLISVKINAFSSVTVPDGATKDGVIHVVSDVLIPPKKLGGLSGDKFDYWQGEDLSVEELVERLAPLVPKHDL